MQDMASLPPIVQAVLSIGLFAVSVVVYIVGNLKKSVPPTSKDVVIPSVTIADRKALDEMVESFTEANRSSREVYEAARDVVYELKSIAGRIDQMERNQRAQLKASQEAYEAKTGKSPRRPPRRGDDDDSGRT